MLGDAPSLDEAISRVRTTAGDASEAVHLLELLDRHPVTESLLDLSGYAVKGDADDHGALRAHLKRCRRGGDAQRLDSLRWWRNDADYADELPWDDTKFIVTEAIKAAEKVFKSLAPPVAGSGSN